MVFFGTINYAAMIAKLLLFLINAVGVELMLWAYVSNRHARPGRYFLLGAFFVLLWVDLDSAGILAPVFFSERLAGPVAAWALRGVYALLAVFFAGFCLYSMNFPEKNALDKSRRVRENILIAVWTFFFVISFTPLVVAGVGFDPSMPLAVWVKVGPLFWAYAIAAAAALAFSFSELSRNRRFADSQNRQKARLAALGAGGFGIFNLLFNVIGPYFSGGFEYAGFFSLFADYAVVILLGYLAYQAVREKLFGIKVILVEIFVGLMGVSLVIMPFFVGLLWQQALLVVLSILFCVFGYLSVKSTIKEYREKEILEQKVSERTKELELAKIELEEANSVLEVRVKARTMELEKLNRTLEEKVAGRTNDLEAKIKALEAFQRITVSRELKMIELKKEIENLRRAAEENQAAEQK